MMRQRLHLRLPADRPGVELGDAVFVQADALKAAADRLARARHEWTEDTITAGLLARLPVSHIRTTQLADGGMREDVVLAGGHVFASRVTTRAHAEAWA